MPAPSGVLRRRTSALGWPAEWPDRCVGIDQVAPHHQKGTANMAQQTTVALIDDIDGGKAAETVSFGLDGSIYEIDLSKKNATALRKALGEFTASARKVRAGKAAAAKVTRSAAAPARVDARAVREWAQEQGIAVSARGRVPSDVVEKYQAAVG